MANLEDMKRKERLRKAGIDINLDYVQKYTNFQCPYCRHIGLKEIIKNKKINNFFVYQISYICPKCGHVFNDLQ